MASSAGELLAVHDRIVRDYAPRPRLGMVVERIGPLILTHYGTHCLVDHPALDAAAAASVARLVAQVQTNAAERGEPVEWRVFAHDAAASNLTAALDAAGFAAGWERGVLVGEVAELDVPEPESGWKVESVRWDMPEALRALELSAASGPHRVPLAAQFLRRSQEIAIRVLTYRGSVVAACWLEDLWGTEFSAVGGMSAPRPELLARLPYEFRPPMSRFLVADADGESRSVLLASGFREVTTVRSHRWAPPGEPASMPPARASLIDAETTQIARRCASRVGFDYARGSGRYTAPVDSRSWFHGMADDAAVAAAEAVIERGLRACVPPGEWVYQNRPYLNGWEFDPRRVGGPGQPRWPGTALADSEFQFLATADARLGTFGHYIEQTVVVFGSDLVEEVADDLDRLLGDGVWTFAEEPPRVSDRPDAPRPPRRAAADSSTRSSGTPSASGTPPCSD